MDDGLMNLIEELDDYGRARKGELAGMVLEAANRLREMARLQSATPTPCEDAINRQAVIDAIDKYDFDFPQYMERFVTELRDAMKADLKADIKDLPSVTPKQRTGHWIETAEEYYKAVNEYGGGLNEDTPYFVDDIACSVCLAKYSVIDNETERFDCCPSCGCRMVEPQESEG